MSQSGGTRPSPTTAGAHPSADAGRLRIILRSHGAENFKSRPRFYTKLLALASVVRAAEESGVGPQLIFWNDGPIPDDRLELMRSTGDVVQIEGGSNRASYRAAIDMAARSDWAPNDLVWFAEDDYLYLPTAFRQLAAAWNRPWDADYVSVYGGAALNLTSSRSRPRELPRMGALDAIDAIEVNGTKWFRGVSTTSTFGVRHSVLREDRRLLRLLPLTGGSWDHTTCLTVQGLRPFSWSELGGELLPFGSMPAAAWPRSIARGALRAGVNLRSMRTSDRRRRLYLSDPVEAIHLELPLMGGEERWEPHGDESLESWAERRLESWADEVRAWALDRGIRVAANRSGLPG